MNTTTAEGKEFCRNFFLYIYSKKVLLFALLLFVYAYEPGDGSIVEFLLIKKFKAEPTAFAISDMVAYLGLMLSSIFYNTFLRHANVYKIVLTTNSIALVLFVFRNFFVTERIQLNTTAFMMLGSFLYAFIGQISFLPFIIISTKFSPVGMEGTVYSFFMAITNFAGIVSRELSGVLTNAYDIKNTLDFDLKSMDYFYGVCTGLDFLGLVSILILLRYILGDVTQVTKLIIAAPNDLCRSDSSKSQEDEQDPNEPLSSSASVALELVDVDLSPSDISSSDHDHLDGEEGGI